MPDKVIAIIQARMSSTRLPGKVLKKICGREMLWHVVTRLRSAETLSDVVIATSTDPSDDMIEKMCGDWGVRCHRGSLEDVLDRYYHAALACGARTIVRITADCPMIDPLIVDEAVKRFFEGGFDHVGLSPGFPDGLDTEVFSFEALERAWKEARLPSEREHVTPYIWKNKDIFRIGNVQNGMDLAHMRWTVDDGRDLAFAVAVYEALGAKGEVFHADDVIKLLKERPWLMDINRGTVRNEGYLKSLDADKKAVGKKRFEKSEALWKRATGLIPSGTQTLSKGPDQFVRGVTPKYLARGKGSHVWDVDDNEYIDYPLALGPILLGYDYPAVVEAVARQLREGTTFTLMHPLEVEVAELLRELIPSAQMVRFAKNGADVTSAAVKVARAATGREHVAYCGYHGCQDWFAVTTPRNKGIPKALGQLMHPFEFNDIGSLKKAFDEHPGRIGAVILEVGGKEPAESVLPSGRPGNFLNEVLEVAHENGALFIMDEIVTGFRFALGGAQERYGVVPDLACFGKGMANGIPISALVGKREYMKELEEVFFSMTYSGDTLGLSAAKATIGVLRSEPVIEHIWRIGAMLHRGMKESALLHGVPFEVSGQPPRASLVFRDAQGQASLDLRSLFLQETVKRGVLFGGPVFISYSHTEKDIEKTLHAFDGAMKVMRKALDAGSVDPFMEGEKVGEVFRRRD